MPKAEWGAKRTCPHCETRFFDLQKEPIVCPECGATYDVDSHGKVSATRERRAPVPAAADDEDDLVDDEIDAADEDDEDEALLGDDEDDAEPASPALSDEDTEEEDSVPFKDPALIDGDEDDDEDEDDDLDLDDDDDDDDIGLDDLPDDEKP